MIKCWKGSNIIGTVVIKGKWPLASVDNQTRDEVEGKKKTANPITVSTGIVTKLIGLVSSRTT